ncbi:TlpA family protein disulfide reductase [Myxococcus fulvus]|uniref:TlpA family protein disulfide reductase n=2 Tax=Myxococcus fulvus TaxID=33 RepID=UPI003B9C1D00
MSAPAHPPTHRRPSSAMLWFLTLLEWLGILLFVLTCAALVGVIGKTLHEGRPATTHAPVLPDYGPLPAFSLSDDTGHPLENKQLRGRVTLLHFLASSDLQPAGLLAVHSGLEAFGLGVDVLLVTRDEPPEHLPTPLPRGWRRLWRGDALEQAVRGVTRGHPAQDATSLLLLVDPLGSVRGIYTDALTQPETARQVEEDARCLDTCGLQR